MDVLLDVVPLCPSFRLESPFIVPFWDPRFLPMIGYYRPPTSTIMVLFQNTSLEVHSGIRYLGFKKQILKFL